jgi:hypothetical protein
MIFKEVVIFTVLMIGASSAMIVGTVMLNIPIILVGLVFGAIGAEIERRANTHELINEWDYDDYV